MHHYRSYTWRTHSCVPRPDSSGRFSRGDDLHHILTQATAYVKDMEAAASEKGKPWTRRPTALM